METLRITILKGAIRKAEWSNSLTIISFEDLKEWVFSGKIIRHLFRYKEVRLLTYRINFLTKPFLTTTLVRLLSWDSCYIQDEQGKRMDVTFFFIVKLFRNLLSDFLKKPMMIRGVRRQVDRLHAAHETRRSAALDLSADPVYLRTDLWFGVHSGGSVGHIAGVLNNLENDTGSPIFLTTDIIPTVETSIETHLITPEESYQNFSELPNFYFNCSFERRASAILDGRKLSFIYQRYSLGSYSGIKLAKRYKIPFVLEYNGSEIWMSRNWDGRKLKYEALAEQIELANLRAADLVVVVSRPMKEELVTRGIDADKILINPNGVDPEKYSPFVDGFVIRERYQLNGKTVVGFIGTFGPWHGAEVLAEAFGRLFERFPICRNYVRLLMIGDGSMMPKVKENLAKFHAFEASILTGLIPQQEGPAHLAACDILVSPHVPNPDGTAFFGSPTKLFEYMAMARGIVASDLDQIGEILRHDDTAWMVKPGDVNSLMLGLKVLIDDEKLRNRLGSAARQEVIRKYTWREHTCKIIEKLKERCK